MSRVFVVQSSMRRSVRSGDLVPKFDLSPAEEYGELFELLSPSARPFESDHVISQLHDGLATYCSDDYLLLIGNPCLIGFAVAIASDVNDGHVKALQWNGKERRYITVSADLK